MHAAIVFGDDEEVMKADPVFDAVVAFIGQQLSLAVGTELGGKHDTFLAQCFNG